MNELYIKDNKKIVVHYLFELNEKELLDFSIKHKLALSKLRASYKESDSNRFEYDDNENLILIEVPYYNTEINEFRTVSVSIVYNQDVVAIVSTKQLYWLKDTLNCTDHYQSVKEYVYSLIDDMTKAYIRMLKKIEIESKKVESLLRKQIKNHSLLDILDLQKSLYYFSDSLCANTIVFKRMLRYETTNTLEYELLEDILTNSEQAIKMADLYINISNSTLDTLASVISNNQNVFIKYLTIISVILMVPTVFASFWGMNVLVPIASNKYAFWIIIAISSIATVFVTIFLNNQGNKLNNVRRKINK